MEVYFVVTCNEDGIQVEPLTKEELQKKLDQNWWEEVRWLDKVPEIDDGYFGSSDDEEAFIIKGQLVVPKATKIAVRHEID